jgi:tetratricopeptide (TPR) repeat protein
MEVCQYNNNLYAEPILFRNDARPMMMSSSHALYHETERLVLLPWTCQPMQASVERLKHVLTFLMQVYSIFWVKSAGGSSPIKNLAKMLEARWDPEVPVKELGDLGLEMLDDLARMHKARYLLTGHVHPLSEGLTPEDRAISIQVTLQLYDARTEQWALNHTLTLSYFEPNCNTLETLHPVTWHLEDCLKQISVHLLSFIATPTEAIASLQEIGQFRLTGNYPLLVQLMEADAQQTAKLKLEALNTLNTNCPEDLLVRYFLAKQYKQGRQYQAAIDTFKTVLGSTCFPPKLKARILNEMGSCAALLGEKEDALSFWLKAIEKDNTLVLAYMNIAHAYEEMGQEAQSEQYLYTVLKLAPTDARVYYSLARIYLCQEKWDKALAQYQLQLLLEPHDPWCHNNIATSYLQQSNPKSAIKHLERAKALDPQGEAGQYAELVLMGLMEEL